jgi:hypothetical protein
MGAAPASVLTFRKSRRDCDKAASAVPNGMQVRKQGTPWISAPIGLRNPTPRFDGHYLLLGLKSK